MHYVQSIRRNGANMVLYYCFLLLILCGYIKIITIIIINYCVPSRANMFYFVLKESLGLFGELSVWFLFLFCLEWQFGNSWNYFIFL
jgi:hypothetical protein